jgi:hypothetical protein
MTAYTLGSLLYEGKAKRVFQTDQADLVAVEDKRHGLQRPQEGTAHGQRPDELPDLLAVV